MPKFCVKVPIKGYAVYEVDALSLDHARATFFDMSSNREFLTDDFDISNSPDDLIIKEIV